MNEPREPREPRPAGEGREPSDDVRALPPVAADPAYRAGLKAAFASGAIESARRAAPATTSTATPRGPLRIPWGGGRPAPGWRITVAIAAAILAIVTTGILNQGPMWRITGVRGAGVVRIDGAPVSVADASALGRMLPPGVRVEVTDGAELDLRAGKVVAMQCTGGTDLVLPPSPPRWFARQAALHVRQGEIRVATGPAFKGATLTVTTPDAALAVTGTTFAVILEPTGTCVCVYEGRVMVGPRSGTPAPVTSGRRLYVFRDGRPVEDASMRDVEHVKLSEFREAQMAAMGAR